MTTHDDELRPFDDDVTRDQVASAFSLDGQEWIFADAGDYQSAAVEAWKRDGSNWQEAIILEWPGRPRGTNDHTTVRLVISPEDAIGLAEVLDHSARWILERRQIRG